MISYAEARAIIHLFPVGPDALERYEEAERRRDFRRALRACRRAAGGGARMRRIDEALWLRRYDEVRELGAFNARRKSEAELRVGLALAAFLGVPVLFGANAYADEEGLETRERGQAAMQSPQSVPNSRHLAKQASSLMGLKRPPSASPESIAPAGQASAHLRQEAQSREAVEGSR